MARLAAALLLAASGLGSGEECAAHEAGGDAMLQAKASLLRALPATELQEAAPACSGVCAWLGWETGTVDSGLAVPLEPSFSKNGRSEVVDGRGRMYESGRLHNVSAVRAPWAREGGHVVQFVADGRNYGKRGDYAWRSELGAVQKEYVFKEGDDFYYTASFWPDETWDQVGKYSTVITQFKMSGQDPHASLRLSNMGDYRLTFRGGKTGFPLWRQDSDEGLFVGVARRKAWNDVKMQFKKSFGSDGLARLWLNGELVFEHRGRTLLGRGKGWGYVKFGLYTELRDVRRIYFDAVSFSDNLDWTTFKAWAAEQRHLPTVELVSPANGTQVASGGSVALRAKAEDPGGEKLGTAGKVARVDFFAASCGERRKVGSAAAGPYEVSLPLPDGAHLLAAEVTDADGNVAPAAPLQVFVGNRPPRVAISAPARLVNLEEGARVSLKAAATDPDGKVRSVTFYAGSQELGPAAAGAGGVYAANWRPAARGSFALTAVAVDDEGAKATSAAVHVTVGAELRTSRLACTDDASLLEARPSSTANWGSSVEVYGSPAGRVAALFKFDVASLQEAAQVREALLQVYAASVKGTGGNFTVFAADGAWGEESVTWRNGPKRGAALSSLEMRKKGEWYSFDVSEHVRGLAGKGAGTASFRVEDAELQYEQVKFFPREKKQAPQLKVTTSTIATVLDEPQPTEEGCGAPVPTTPTPSARPSPAPAAPTASPTDAPTTAPTTSPTAAPTLAPASTGLLTMDIASAGEASVREAKPTSTGNWGDVEVYGKPGGRIAGIFKFRLADLPSGTHLQKALLRVYADSIKGDGGEFTVFAATHSDWDEASVTWDNGPSRGKAISSLSVTQKGQFYEFDVTAHAQALAKGGAAALSLWMEDAQLAYHKVEFDSSRSDQQHPPLLRVSIPAASKPPATPGPVASDTAAPTPSPSPAPTLAPAPMTLRTFDIPSVGDASVRESKPSSTGNWGDVEVYGKPGGRIAGIFKFMLTKLLGDVRVEKAVLRLYADSVKGDGGDFTLFAASHSNWDENSVTWSNGPSRGKAISSLSVTKEGHVYEFDVTNHLRAHLKSGATAVSLWIEDAELGYRKVEFDGSRSDQQHPPQLRISVASTTDAAAPTQSPTLSPAPMDLQTISIPSAGEASVRESKPDRTGNWGDVEVYGKPGGRIAGLFKFQLADIPSDVLIRKAVLRVYADSIKAEGGEFTCFGASNSDWDEASVTWSNGPSRGKKISSVSITHKDRFYDFDMTDHLQAEITSGATAVSLWIEDAQLGYHKVEFDGSRSDQPHPPQLRLSVAAAA